MFANEWRDGKGNKEKKPWKKVNIYMFQELSKNMFS